MDYKFLKREETSLFKLLHSSPLFWADQDEQVTVLEKGMEQEENRYVPAFMEFIIEPSAVQ